MSNKYQKHYFKMVARLFNLFFINKADCDNLVSQSYNRISDQYDQVWTNHMRDLTADMINRLDISPDSKTLDLTCGTGYATSLLAAKTNIAPIGVDRSTGMIEQARQNHGDKCNFVISDIIEFLKDQPSQSYDTITCCWGLGYSKPYKVVKQIKRILKPGGQVGIIDNSLFSLKEIMYCSFLTFTERPDKLQNLMRFKFLPGCNTLTTLYHLAGLKPKYKHNGSKSYYVNSGKEAVNRLRSTGAAAGFEYAASETDSDEIFSRFAEIIEQKYMKDGNIEVIHRFLTAIAIK